MTTEIVPARNSVPEVIRRLPRRTRTLLAQIQTEAGVSIEQAAFVALRAFGFTQEAAYHLVRPHVKVESANQNGCRWDRALSHLVPYVPADAAQEIISDWRTALLSLHDDPSTSLKAIDISNRVLRRYADEGIAVTVMGDVKLEDTRPAEDAATDTLVLE